jgi:hypothetical protein
MLVALMVVATFNFCWGGFGDFSAGGLLIWQAFILWW